MHILIVEFDLHGLGAAEYETVAADLSRTFAAVPGLLSKTWIANAETGVAGGVYTWADAEACDAYLEGELFAALRANPAMAAVRHRRFDVAGVTEGAAPATA